MTASQGFTQKLYEAAAQAADAAAAPARPMPRGPTTRSSTPRSSTTRGGQGVTLDASDVPTRSAPVPPTSPGGRPDDEVVGELIDGRRRRGVRRPARGSARWRCRRRRADGRRPRRAAAAVEVDLELLLAEREEFLGAYRRTQADFENYRKQSQRQQDDAVVRSLGGFVESLLPVLDACDAAVPTAARRVEPIWPALYGALEKEGLERIDPAGKPFDPAEAEAVMHEPGEGGPHPSSPRPCAPGYRWRGRGAAPGHGQGHRLRKVDGAQREWFEKDYYRVLGVSETATAKEIKSAYRKLSRQYHPDANPGDKAAEERFKEVSAAYDVVGDAEKRKEYDEVRRLGPVGGVPRGGRGGRRRAAFRSRTSATSATCSAACSAAAAGRRCRGGPAAAPARTAGRTSRPSCTSPSTTPSGASPPRSTSPARRRAPPATARAPARAPPPTRAPSATGGACSTTTRGCSASPSRAPSAPAGAYTGRRPVPHVPRHRRRAPAPARSRCASRRASRTASASG